MHISGSAVVVSDGKLDIMTLHFHIVILGQSMQECQFLTSDILPGRI